MKRRDFLALAGAAGGAALLPSCAGVTKDGASASEALVDTGSRRAWAQLLEALRDADLRYLGPERGIRSPADVSDGHRLLMHQLSWGLDFYMDGDAERPVFKRIVTPTRKMLGDNPDAIYFMALVRGDRAYRVRGNLAGATYTSVTLESGTGDGGYPTRTSGVLNDTQIDVAADGSFELLLTPTAESGRNRLRLESDVGSITTRSYFETEACIAGDLEKRVPLQIEPLEDPGPRRTWDDEQVEAGIRRVTNYFRGVTVDENWMAPEHVPAWVSMVPNQFNPPALPGAMGYSNYDAHYTMAPYALADDEALVIRGRFPECRFANVVLWNRFGQTYDYLRRRVSLNRAQTRLEPDGSYRIVVAHTDPGVPNWIDTEGRRSGTIYWRFLLAAGNREVETPHARVVKHSEVAKA